MKNPHLQLKEAIFEISKYAYKTDEDFKEMEAKLENFKVLRDRAITQLKFVSFRKRAKNKLQIDIFNKKIEELQLKLQDYLNICLEENGKVEIKNPNQEKLDEAFAKAAVAHERIYLIYKYTKPHLLEDFTKIATDCYTPEEMEEFFARVAKREETELGEILAAVKDDGTSLNP